MRRLSISVLAGLLVVGLVAAPAIAERTRETGYFPHKTFVHLCAPWCPAEVKELPTGQWADIGAGWETKTEAQRDHFPATAIVEIEGDGVVHTDIPPFLVGPEAGYGDVYFAVRAVRRPPGEANAVQVWTMRVTFTEDHFDGWYWYSAGSVDEVTRTIVWTPRGQFPSGDYPPSDY